MITTLTIVFIVLKLVGVIHWHWLLVVSPALFEWFCISLIAAFVFYYNRNKW